MRLLQLSKKVPFPMKDGESIAVTQSARCLAERGVEMDLLTFNTAKHSCDLADARRGLSHYRKLEAVDLDNRVKPLDALKNLLFTRDSYHVERFVDPVFTERLIRMLRDGGYDVVQLETIYTAPYISVIRKFSTASIVLRAHNVEHEIWQRLTANTRNPLKAAYLRILTDRLRTFELAQLDRVDAMLSISPKDDENFRRLGFQGRSLVLPISLNLADYQPAPKSESVSLSFIGSLDWFPNLEGLEWFLANVNLDGLRCPFTGEPVKFHVAGRNPPERIAEDKRPSLCFHGEVPSAVDFINAHPIMVVPLFSGSGMRTKILEAMALERVVITTSLGLEGIDAIDGEEVLIADSGDEFRAKLDWLLEDPERIDRIGKAGRTHVEQHYDAPVMAGMLETFLDSLDRDKHTAKISIG